MDGLDARASAARRRDRSRQEPGLVAQLRDAQGADAVPGSLRRRARDSADGEILRLPAARTWTSVRSRSGPSSAGTTKCSACSGSTTATATARCSIWPASCTPQGHDWEAQFANFKTTEKVPRAPGESLHPRREQRDGDEGRRGVVAGHRRQGRPRQPLPDARRARSLSRAAQRHLQRGRALRRARSLAGHRTVRRGRSHVLAGDRYLDPRRRRVRRPPGEDRLQRAARARSAPTCGRTSTISRPTR